MSPGARRQFTGSERAREREAKKIRGRNAGPLAPSSPWLQSLRRRERGSWPQVLQASTTTVQNPAGLFPPPRHGFRDPVACPRVPVCVSLSLSLGRGASQVPQMPAAIFVLLSPWPLPVSFPTATAHGAENVAKLQLGKFRSQPSVASRTNGRWESLNHEHRHSPTSATRLWPVTR